MACLEPCHCGQDPNCPDCKGTGGVVVDAMVWGAKRGLNPYPTAKEIKDRKKREERWAKEGMSTKPNLFEKIVSFAKRVK